MNFYMVRLGPDSVPTINQLDSSTATTPMAFDVVCKQVPTSLTTDDFVFIWLGTDNGKGSPTRWKQGLRALGKVTAIAGPPGRNESKTVSISVGHILKESIAKFDAANSNRVNYRELFNLPVVGTNNYSSQVIQKIDPSKPAQNLGGLIAVINEREPDFTQKVTALYPELAPFFTALPTFAPDSTVVVGSTLSTPSPTFGWELPAQSLDDLDGLVGMKEPALRAFAALRAGMHVIFTGPPGTGKTQLAEAICKKAGIASWTVPATDQWTTFETIGGYFPVPNGEDGDSKSERLDFMPGAIVDAISRGCCLIIDEINRADIDKAFGEMFTLLAGTSVTLPYKRRGPDGFLRIRIQVDNAPPEADIDVIPLPKWWRLIGAMNDADKASLKRLSLAFVRRFAFVPVNLPEKSLYESLLDTRLAEFDAQALSDSRMVATLASIKKMFCSPDVGFSAFGMPFGPAIPLAMLRHAAKEAFVDPARTPAQILASGFDLYVAPQFQGRADLHESCCELIRSEIPDADIAESVVRALTVWTGYDS